MTGDGDALSIGGNHLIHALRRNVNLKILFNNRIYGLTKGHRTRRPLELGKVTKSTPMGSLDHPFNPLSVAIAEATFVARAIDTDKKELTEDHPLRTAQGERIRRDLPELQHLQRQRLRLRPRPEGKPLVSAPRRADHVGRHVRWLVRDGLLEVVAATDEGLLVHDAHTPEPVHAFHLSRMTAAPCSARRRWASSSSREARLTTS